MDHDEKIARWEHHVAEMYENLPEELVSRLCPATRHLPDRCKRACFECPEGCCVRFGELGLDDTGEPLEKVLRPKCGARTRSGNPCQAHVVPGKRRCRMHGGLSTGPKTAEGRDRIRQAQKRRWKE